MFGRAEGGLGDGEAGLGAEVGSDGFAEELASVGGFLFGLLFVPDENADGSGFGRAGCGGAGEGSEAGEQQEGREGSEGGGHGGGL